MAGEPLVLAVGGAAARQRQPEVGLVDPEVASVVTLVQALGLLQVELLKDPSAHARSASFLEAVVPLAVPRFPLAALAEPMDPTQDWVATSLTLACQEEKEEQERGQEERGHSQEGEQEEEARTQSRAAQEQAHWLRRIEEEQAEAQRNAEALAAADEARRASGEVQVCVYLNRSLKIKVEFWMTPGSPGKTVHDTFAREVLRKFPNMSFDPAAVALQYCEDGVALGDCFRNGDEDSRIELEINRSPAAAAE